MHAHKSKHERILILSHMRSGSTLLTHILAANPEILGLGELHIPMSDTEYPAKMARRLLKSRNIDHFGGRYYLDKLLHNHLCRDSSIWENPNYWFIFLIREPAKSIPSIRKLDYFKVKPEETNSYYKGRIQMLVNHATTICEPSRMFFLTWRELVYNTESCLMSLSTFLQLRTPLREDYKTYETTGVKGIGDFSERIKTGRIQRDPEDAGAPDALHELFPTYEETSKQLKLLCQKAG